ncbi:MAG: SAF domain-containing protein [Mycobacteriales bacterium]|nr:MAG: hypothetical protein DLM56_00515 [Pseudonocardiales bacterium]
MTTSVRPTKETGRRGSRGNTGPDRMPVPSRQRRPGLAALALVLILGGAALSAYLVLHSSQKVALVVTRTEIKAGQQIPASALAEAHIAAQFDQAVPYQPWAFAEAGQLVGQYATTTIPAGTILSRAMVARSRPSTSCTEVTVSVANGFYPAGGVHAGDLVKLVYFPSANNTGGGTGGGGTTPAAPKVPSVIANAAYVLGVANGSGTSGGQTVTVYANNSGQTGQTGDDLTIAQANALGGVQVIRYPADTPVPSDLQKCGH